MNEQEKLEQELQEYQQKVWEITERINQIQIEEEDKLQAIIDNKDKTLAKLAKLIGDDTRYIKGYYPIRNRQK